MIIILAAITMLALFLIVYVTWLIVKATEKTGKQYIFAGIYLFVILPFVFYGFYHFHMKRQARGDYRLCIQNHKEIGQALEIYAKDNDGLYPDFLPGRFTSYNHGNHERPYAGEYQVSENHRRFTVFCKGSHHKRAGVPENFPQFTSVKGLVLPR